MSTLTLFTDGASRGNPGNAAIGVVVLDSEGSVVREFGRYISTTPTNNVAEWTALVAGLEAVHELGATTVRINTDSEVVARQLLGEYKVRAQHFVPFVQRARQLLRDIGKYEIQHIPREKNTRADALANRALDERFGVSLQNRRTLSRPASRNLNPRGTA